MMAAAGFFRIVLHGKGGHGSLPHLANNPIDCAVEIMTVCRAIVPEGCVLTFCACNAGTNNIIIPADLELKGTVRFLDAEKGRKMVADFEKTVREICTRRGIGCDFSCPVPYLPVVNRPVSAGGQPSGGSCRGPAYYNGTLRCGCVLRIAGTHHEQ